MTTSSSERRLILYYPLNQYDWLEQQGIHYSEQTSEEIFHQALINIVENNATLGDDNQFFLNNQFFFDNQFFLDNTYQQQYPQHFLFLPPEIEG